MAIFACSYSRTFSLFSSSLQCFTDIFRFFIWCVFLRVSTDVVTGLCCVFPVHASSGDLMLPTSNPFVTKTSMSLLYRAVLELNPSQVSIFHCFVFAQRASWLPFSVGDSVPFLVAGITIPAHNFSPSSVSINQVWDILSSSPLLDTKDRYTTPILI